MSRPLYVAQPLLPKFSSFADLLEKVWETKVLTNIGPFHQQLELELEKLMGLQTTKLFNNGTTALLVALKLLDLPRDSEVITTPLTFAATAHSISWMGLKPVFVDVCQKTLTIDPECVRKAISSKTSAIMAVHVYGTLCDFEELDSISSEYNIKLIYDAAHAFSSTIQGKSVGAYGDISVFSFHATKLFHTIEGGLITSSNIGFNERIESLRNFGIKNQEEVTDIGINGKLNEIQAIMGILNLEIFESERAKRKILRENYDEFLTNLPGISLQPVQDGVVMSEQYYPIIIDEKQFGKCRDSLYENLKRKGIYARKYFHPICTDFGPYKNWPICSLGKEAYVNKVKGQLLCLPFHSGVDVQDIADIKDEFMV